MGSEMCIRDRYSEDDVKRAFSEEFEQYGFKADRYIKENENEYLTENDEFAKSYKGILKKERLIGALKVAILMAVNVVVLNFVEIPYEYLYPLYLVVLVHPYSEITSMGYKNRSHRIACCLHDNSGYVFAF